MVRRIMLACACVLAITSPCVAQYYTVRALERLPGTTQDWAKDINDLGQVVGWARTPSGTNYPVVWDTSGAVSRIGTMSNMNTASANAINNSGVIAGKGRDGTSGAFVWSPTDGLTYLPMTAAYDINSQGQVCGFTADRAKVWNPDGTVIDIGPVGDSWAVYGRSINDSGEVAGYGYNGNSFEDKAFLWRPYTGVTMLPVISMNGSCASSINSRGQITGYVHEPGRRTGVVWEPDGTITRLNLNSGQVVSTGWGINDAGYVTGYVSTSWGGNDCPALWTNDNVEIMLPLLPGCDLGDGLSINSKNQIVGYCTSRTTWESYPVMWELVPEPSSLLALSVALGGLAAMGKSRKARPSR